MLRILRYLKPYTLSVVVVLALLFAQAMAELALPNYMSDIVNVGIQQGGVENALPEAIRKTELEKMYLFMTPEEKNSVESAYTVFDSSAPEAASTLKRFTRAGETEVYTLNELTADQIQQLSPITGKALLAVYTLEQASADPQKAAALSQQTGMDLTRIPQGTDVFAMLKQLPEEQLQGMVSAVNSAFANMDSRVITQAANAAVKAEYSALGADPQILQTQYILRVGGLTLDRTRYQVLLPGAAGVLTEVILTPTEFELLYTLAAQPGRIFSRAQLLTAARGVAFESYERAIDSHIRNLRRKLELPGSAQEYIVTVHGVGYKFAG